MSERMQQFVHGAFTALGATVSEVAPGAGVWRADLPQHAARYLGRTQPEAALYTFDLERWDEGARLECLHAQSPLVQRLQEYALARGALTVAHAPHPEDEPAEYQPYLIARFSARFSGEQVTDEARWLGINLTTGQPLRIKGDPLATPGLLPGAPSGYSLDAADSSAALAKLTEQWNEEIDVRARAVQAGIDRSYRIAAESIAASLPAEHKERDRAWERLRERMQMTVECRLVIVLVLWLPAR